MDLASIGLRGLKQAETRLEHSARKIAKPVEPGKPVETDLAAETVGVIEAVNTYTANLKLIRVRLLWNDGQRV
jgi:hypothetical protein